MAHFAELDENNLVVRVLVTDNDFPGEGLEWLEDTFGGVWIQTSYNANIRGKFAAIGDTYDPNLDVFVAPYSKPVEIKPTIESEI